MAQRNCVACGADFYPRHEQQRTCSNRCYMWNRSHPGQPRPTERTCPGCGSTFAPTHAATLYCDRRCSAAASKRRTRPIAAAYTRHTTCQRCGGPMPAGARASQKYCSPECGLRDRHAERAAMAVIGMRHCTHCDAEFRPKSRRNVTCSPRCSGLAHYYANRESYTERTMRWFEANPERRLANVRAWAERNTAHLRAKNLAWTRSHPDRVAVIGQRRRAAKRDNPDSVGVSTRDWQRALRRADGRCYYCGAKPDETLHMEHVIPLSRGGRHAIGNVVPACRTCNLQKHDKLVSEWRRDVMRQWLRESTHTPEMQHA
jgi:5-methylcytosine-specific restriction endonuclease McrA